ncbi:MAG: hypothetical protein JOZ08_05800 [Verrucomicrobia bacterium]|nr:hypothetical protein [Verrucomicrobiota bacterium]
MKHRVGLRIVSGFTRDAFARRNSLRTSLRPLVLVTAFGLSSYLGLYASDAQLTIIHNFGNGTASNSGTVPNTGLIQAPDGNFYGTAAHNTAGLGGTTYQLTPNGVLTTIHHFRVTSQKSFSAKLLYYKGELIAPIITAFQNTGPLLAATNLSGEMSMWHQFTPADGGGPRGSLILGSDGNLYGTCYGGGSGGYGTIYKINPTPPYAFSVVYTFSYSSLGISPAAGLLLAQDGNYYGTTEIGTTPGGGTIFQMTPAGQVTFVYHFPGATDYCDSPLIQDKNGNFYGSTIDGGTYRGGYIFKMSSTFQVTILHQFGHGTDGSWPNDVVLGPNGNLYGTTIFGGKRRFGTVYELSTDGTSYTVLHNFADGTIANDGKSPEAGLTLGSDNNLYGTTNFGGSAGNGTAFRISP